MSLLQWNICGFVSNREQVRVLFKEYNLSAMCIQETKLGDHTPYLGFDYSFYRSPPLIGVRAQGGTGIVVRKSVNHRVVHLNSVLQASAIQIFTNKWVTICSLYLDPSLENRLQDVQGCPRQLELNDLQSLIDQLPQPFILMGDFNAKHNLWGESCCDRWGLIIEQLLDLNDVTLLNDGSPTRHDVFHNTDSAIDLTICSSSLRLDYQWAVDQNDHGSDHWPIHLKYVKNIPSPCLPKWKVGEADWGLFNKSTEINRGVNDFQSSTAAYERKSNEYIVLNHFWETAQFASVNKKGSYDRDKLKTALDYLLFNSFVRFGPHVFKQIKGIPMGGNASPLIADLFLANLEFKYMDKLVSSKSPENLRMAKKLSNNSRYIDDIGVCNMNNNNEFMICSKDIYPESIPLTTGCIENDKDTFLDLDITLEENRFITKIYNKVDDFDFEVVSFPFPTSNMSDHITYNSFYSQLVRFSSVCSKFNDFDIRSRNLLESLLNRGFSKYRLKNSFSKFALNHHDVLDIKYSMEEINEFIRSHFS